MEFVDRKKELERLQKSLSSKDRSSLLFTGAGE